jgi:hypothetical protein
VEEEIALGLRGRKGTAVNNDPVAVRINPDTGRGHG